MLWFLRLMLCCNEYFIINWIILSFYFFRPTSILYNIFVLIEMFSMTPLGTCTHYWRHQERNARHVRQRGEEENPHQETGQDL